MLNCFMYIANCPFNKIKILSEATTGLEKSFWMMYSNLNSRETVPLNRLIFKMVFLKEILRRKYGKRSLKKKKKNTFTDGLQIYLHKTQYSTYCRQIIFINNMVPRKIISYFVDYQIYSKIVYANSTFDNSS